MPAVLTTAATITCAHGGTVTAQASTTQLSAGGAPVLVQADLLAATVSGCPNANASAGQAPCLKVTSVTAGVSVNLSVAGQPVLLENAQGLTNATPPLPVMWQVQDAGQSVLEAS